MAAAAVAHLLRTSAEWRYFFRQCCETSGLRLRSQAWQWHDELRGQGQDFTLEDLEDALSDLACQLLPDSPGAAWDGEWAAERATEALRYLGSNFPECLENLRALDEHEVSAHEAAMKGDRDGYLEALTAYMRAGRDEALRIRRGAA